MDPRLDWSLRHAEELRRLSDPQAPHVVERQEQSVVLVQPLERTPERPALDDPVEIVGGAGERCIQLDDAAALTGPTRARGRPDDMAPKPGRKGKSGSAKPVEPLPGGQQRLLDGIGGVRRGAGQDRRRPKCDCEMRFHKRAKRITVPRPCGGDERLQRGPKRAGG